MDNDICTYCGENKWENKDRHLAELAVFLQKRIEECQDIIKSLTN